MKYIAFSFCLVFLASAIFYPVDPQSTSSLLALISLCVSSALSFFIGLLLHIERKKVK